MNYRKHPGSSRLGRTKFRGRRALSDIVGTLIMIAIVASLGVLTFTFASSGLGSLSQNFTNLMGSSGNAISEKYVVEQVTFTTSAGLALDGSTTAGSGAGATNSQTTGTLTTVNANDVIVVIASLSDGSGGSTTSNTVSTVTATGLTFTLRKAVANFVSPNYFADVEEWYAITSSTFSNTITVTTTGSFRFTVIAFGISGANTASPFDPNAGANPTASGASSTPSVTQSTSNANDILITGLAVSQTPGTVTTFPTGYTNIANVATGGSGSQARGVSDYDVVSAIRSSSAVSYVLSSSTNSWAMLGDAIQAFPQGADVYVRNVGSNPTTLVSVYIVDQTSNTFVSQTTISTAVNVGTFADIPHTTLTFTPSHGHTYSFTVTSSLGNSVIYNAKAT